MRTTHYIHARIHACRPCILMRAVNAAYWHIHAPACIRTTRTLLDWTSRMLTTSNHSTYIHMRICIRLHMHMHIRIQIYIHNTCILLDWAVSNRHRTLTRSSRCPELAAHSPPDNQSSLCQHAYMNAITSLSKHECIKVCTLPPERLTLGPSPHTCLYTWVHMRTSSLTLLVFISCVTSCWLSCAGWRPVNYTLSCAGSL
jgi:hypothetical protein